MRLFVGIELPDDVKNHIASYVDPIKQSEKGWEKPHDYHQTLLFIGEASEDDLHLIKNRMDHFRFDPFYLGLNDFEFFPRRVMYMSFLPSPELVEVKQKLDDTFPEWQRPGSKPFLPHVTVKRWQRYEFDHLKNGLSTRSFSPKNFKVKYISLFKSEKDPENNKYHVIHRSPSN